MPGKKITITPCSPVYFRGLWSQGGIIIADSAASRAILYIGSVPDAKVGVRSKDSPAHEYRRLQTSRIFMLAWWPIYLIYLIYLN